MENKSFIIFSHSEKSDNIPGENTPPLNPLNPLKKRQKAQISSIPGVSPKELNRYQVKIGDEVIGTELSSDEALKLAKQGGES